MLNGLKFTVYMREYIFYKVFHLFTFYYGWVNYSNHLKVKFNLFSLKIFSVQVELVLLSTLLGVILYSIDLDFDIILTCVVLVYPK